MHETESAAWVRAGFWRRALALLVDLILVAAIVGMVGFPLYGLTDGAVRVSRTIIQSFRCTPTNLDRPDLSLPPNFKPTTAHICSKSLFGREYERLLVLTEVTRSEVTRTGTYTVRRTLALPVDANNRLARPLYIDHFMIFFIVAYLIVLEWCFGKTVGKRVFRSHVRSLTGEPITASQAAIRTFVRLFPFFPIVLLELSTMLGPVGVATWFLANAFVVGALSLLLVIIFLLNFILAVRRGQLPWHDRFAETEVVRLAPRPPPLAQPTPSPAG